MAPPVSTPPHHQRSLSESTSRAINSHNGAPESVGGGGGGGGGKNFSVFGQRRAAFQPPSNSSSTPIQTNPPPPSAQPQQGFWKIHSQHSNHNNHNHYRQQPSPSHSPLAGATGPEEYEPWDTNRIVG